MQFRPPDEHNYPAYVDKYSQRTGFWENYNAALGITLTEDLPIVSRFIPSFIESEQTKKILDYNKQGIISDELLDYYDGDMDGLLYYARHELGLTDLLTPEEYQKKYKEEYSIYRNYSNEVMSHASLLGKFGSLVGSAHAYMLDPLYAVSAFTGYGTAATALQAAVNAMVVEGAISALAQPFKMQWKHRIGADYSATDAIVDTLITAGSAGIISGLGKAVSNMFSKGEPLRVKDARPLFEKVAKDYPEEMKPLLITLDSADENAPLDKVLKESEQIDVAINQPFPEKKREFKVVDDAKEEEIFNKWATSEEGVPHGTPLKEDVEEVNNLRDLLEIIKKCY